MATPLFLGLAGSVVGFLVTWFLTSVVCGYAPRLGLLDHPTNPRKVHKTPTPTGGGLAIAVGAAAGLGLLWGLWGPFSGALQSLSFWGGAVVMLATGYWDDKHALDAKGKFALQLVAAYLLLRSGAVLPLADFGTGSAIGAVAGLPPFEVALHTILLSILWIVGIINAVNLIDGLDGLASGIIGIAFLACAALFGVHGELGLMAVGVAMSGALIGFLLHNFKPASIFMGDSGSLFLGYLLAGYTLQAPLHADSGTALLILPLLLGVPVLDTGTAIVRRFLSTRTIFAPDRHHLHHRLVAQGSEKRAVLTLYGVAAWFGSAAVLMSVLPTVWGYVLAGSTAVVALVWAWRLGCLTPITAEEESEEQPSIEPPIPSRTITVGDTSSAGGDGFHLETASTPEQPSPSPEQTPTLSS